MKKFHKRAAVFLTAATLAGLPAGAFFYSSPGSLTVWADNVEVESSEESSPEDVDFSDGSEDISKIEDYHSHNTQQQGVEGMKELLLKLPLIRKEVLGEDITQYPD